MAHAIFRKRQKGSAKGLAIRGSDIVYGDFGIKATEMYFMKKEVIDMGKGLIVKTIGKDGKVWVMVHADKPVTKKPAGVRMGSGKGDVETSVAIVKPGRILYEISNVSRDVAKRAAELIDDKLPIKVVFVEKREQRIN